MLTSAAHILPPKIWSAADAGDSEIRRLYALGLLEPLLADRTTRKNIIWATDTYQEFGKGFGRKDAIDAMQLVSRYPEIRAARLGKRIERTRKHGEVFTPLWICKKMCDHAHKVLGGMDWQKYVNATVLEITCGEAPFLASRRDLATGSLVPLAERVGLLDRKIKIITEKVKNRDEWLEWVFKAYQATYGYEFQGDNLLLARINLLKTFEENLWERWTQEPTQGEYRRIVDIIVWNIWQMDGLTGTIPYGKIGKPVSLDLFGSKSESSTPACLIRDWQAGRNVEYLALQKTQ